MRSHLSLLVKLALLFLPFVAVAQDDEDANDHVEGIFKGFEIQAGTEFPIQMGVRARIDLPNNFYLHGGLGYSPSFYGDSVGSFGNAMGLMGSSTSNVISQAMHNAFYMDLRVGYKLRTSRKFFDGMFIDFGYSLMVANGGTAGITDISNMVGTVYPFATSYTNATVKSTIHNLTAHAGYTWSTNGHLILTGEVGLIKPVASVNRITTNNDPIDANQMQNDIANKMDSVYKNQVFIPTFGLWASYLF